MEKQSQLQEIYEGRIASMQRLIAFLVMFHAMAKRVQDFWPRVSFGLLGYDMSRSQSIMRIATTASPVSGSDVRHKMKELAVVTAKQFCAHILTNSWVARNARVLHISPLITRSKSASELATQIEVLQRLHKRQLSEEAMASPAADPAPATPDRGGAISPIDPPIAQGMEESGATSPLPTHAEHPACTDEPGSVQVARRWVRNALAVATSAGRMAV